MKSKTDIIAEAIQNNLYLAFDYVSKERKITLSRLVLPIEIILTDKHGLKLWAKDVKQENLLKQFDVEGIQEPRIVAKAEGGDTP